MPTNNTSSSPKALLPVLFLFAVAFMGRLLPHPPNFTPMGGIALFGAAVLSSRWLAVAIPFLALYLSDLILNNVVYAEYFEGFSWGISFSVYLGFAAMIALGFLALRGRELKSGRLAITAISASLLFYLITNFFSWFIDPFNLYADNATGLAASYIAALPFLFNSLLGDLFFVGVLFSAYAWYRNRQQVIA